MTVSLQFFLSDSYSVCSVGFPTLWYFGHLKELRGFQLGDIISKKLLTAIERFSVLRIIA